MNPSITPSQLVNQYQILHQSNQQYGAGAAFGERILKLSATWNLTSFLDYGCGKGKLADFIRDRNWKCDKYDPAIPGIDHYPNRTYDLIIANDVFEHLHPNTYDEEIRKFAKLSRRGIFLNISCRPAVHHLPNGENCHTLVKTPYEWMIYLSYTFKEFDLLNLEYNPKNKNLILIFMKP